MYYHWLKLLSSQFQTFNIWLLTFKLVLSTLDLIISTLQSRQILKWTKNGGSLAALWLVFEHPYSETGCSFARHFAILSRNVGILIGSLLRAGCELKFQLANKSGMFQVLLQYFEDRYASFYVQNPITDLTELLERVKKAVPVLKGIPEDQIRISYKDVQLGTS